MALGFKGGRSGIGVRVFRGIMVLAGVWGVAAAARRHMDDLQ